MKKMYVIVRKDLDKIYSMVQGAHALAGFIMLYPEKAESWNNSDLIFVRARDENQLFKWREKLRQYTLIFTWEEPDRDNELTAVAAYAPEEVVPLGLMEEV